MAKQPTKPLEIKVFLRGGRLISADGIVMFDSILYHAWFYKYAPHVLRGEGDEKSNKYIGLPLRQLTGNRWAASKAIYEETSKTVEFYNKRPDFFASDKIGHLKEEKGIISDSAGLYRAYRNPVIVRTVKNDCIKFYCMGHKEEIADLLSYMPAVGKKPSMGFGIITKIEIRDIDADYSLYHPKYGLMRPLPVSEAHDYGHDLNYPIMKYGVKPPYWKPCNAELCYVPINIGGKL